MTRISACVWALALAFVCAACSDPTAPAPPTQVAPTITDSFTGTLTPGSTNLHQFDVNQVGGVKVTLTSMQPDIAIDMSVGSPSPATGLCVPFSTVTTKAGSTPQISGTATTAGHFCVSITDGHGNVTDTATYSVTVLHS